MARWSSNPRPKYLFMPLGRLLTVNIHQWRNAAPGAPATPGGAAHKGRQIVTQMWDNFARLTARLAKMRVFFNNFAIF